jgi:3-isopropylmalate/(R)-2-methylmalate dehydratase large subunit
VPEAATLFHKIWSAHEVLVRDDGATPLHMDRHLVHDSAANVFTALAERGLPVRRPDRTFATPDHYVATIGRREAIAEAYRRDMVDTLEARSREAGITLFGLDDARQGIVHVVGPEQGISQAGHADRLRRQPYCEAGALGALAFGIGSSEGAHVLGRRPFGRGSQAACASQSTAGLRRVCTPRT